MVTRISIVLAAIALAGCGAAAGSSGNPSLPRLVAYSHCMRAHGVPKFPDPDKNGNLIFTPGLGIDPSSPQYKRAQKACAKYLPAAHGAGMTPAQHAKALAQLTKYVHCMRKHGIPMANPFSGPNGGVGIVLPSGVDPNGSLYRNADAACTKLLPKGG